MENILEDLTKCTVKFIIIYFDIYSTYSASFNFTFAFLLKIKNVSDFNIASRCARAS